MNLYDNSGINCNKKNRIYDLYKNNILNKFAHSNKYKNSTILIPTINRVGKVI